MVLFQKLPSDPDWPGIAYIRALLLPRISMRRYSLNPPYGPPPRHHRLDDQFRATDEAVDGRLPSGAYLPVPLPDRDTALRPANTLDVHKRINQIREHLKAWHNNAYPVVHGAT